MRVIKFILSCFYAFGVWLRNLLFDEHVFYVYHPSIPTICVGNLAVGGTGKTPHVEYIIRLLLKENYKVAVLSRGYKRLTKGFILAGCNDSAETIGDEPRQMQLKFPDIVVAVCEDRTRGVRRICKLHPEVDVIVLDDAFQHRRIRCGYNVLLTPIDRLYTSDSFLPLGRLREHPRGALRADIICVTKCPSDMQPIQRRVTSNHLKLAAFQDIVFSFVNYVNGMVQEKGYLLAGIAQPNYLLKDLGDKVKDYLFFPDHYRYKKKDLELIEKRFSEPLPIYTTEKDYIRLTESPLLSNSLRDRLVPLPVEVDFKNDAQLFNSKLLRYVHENINHKKKKPTTDA